MICHYFKASDTLESFSRLVCLVDEGMCSLIHRPSRSTDTVISVVFIVFWKREKHIRCPETDIWEHSSGRSLT